MSEHASNPGIAFVIEPGTMADYRALGHWHYRSGKPRAAVLVLRAIVEKKTAGVLVVTMPVLNGRWRETAWPGWLGPHDRRERARLINAELRTIARVIVEPRHRGAGLATALVREYLRRPLTHRTEALAAMGALCPFFTSAGMREIAVAPSPVRAKMLAMLDERRVERWMLADRGVRRLLQHDGVFMAALRAWTRTSRGTKPWRNLSDGELLERACELLSSEPRVYVCDSNRGGQHGQASEEGGGEEAGAWQDYSGDERGRGDIAAA